jgi:hypothetical protein
MGIRRLKALYNRTFRKREIEAQLVSLDFQDGNMDAVLKFPGIAILTNQIAGYFDETGGKNWVEVTMFDNASMRMFVVTIQRKGGETPAQKIKRLEAEIEQLKADAT